MKKEIQVLEQKKRPRTWQIFLMERNPLDENAYTKSNINQMKKLKIIRSHLLQKDTQLEGVDYLEVFFSVAKLTTVRLLLVIAVIQN